MKTVSVLAMIVLMTVVTTSASPPPFQIMIDSGSPYYDPSSPRVPAGSPIRWDNPTASPHTITHDGCFSDESACVFDSGSVPPGGSYSVPGLPPGRYPYQCRLHPIMRGMLVIIDSTTSSQT